MIVTAWNNGLHRKTGAGYGLKIEVSDRDRYFKESWKTVFIHLPNGRIAEVNTDKPSFWNDSCNDSCRELIKHEIGKWLIEIGEVPWSPGAPPKFKLCPLQARHFGVK